MSTDTARVTGPAPEQFAGNSTGQSLKRLFHATRPKFFPASVMPVLVGTAWGVHVSGRFDAVAFLLALLATVCVHAGANVLNDVGDDAGGTDRRNDDRIYPYTGGSRFIQTGILSASAMARLGSSLLLIAAVAGLVLLLLKGPMILAFGFAGVLLAVLYSLGPVRLASLGLGELAVGVAFGVLPVTGSAWLQSGVVDSTVVLYSLPVSAWVAAILLINEVPDMAADGATGKRTLPVRLGTRGTALLYAGLHLFGASVVVGMAVTGMLPLAALAGPLLLLLLAFKAASAIPAGIGNRPAMTAGIEATLGIHTLGSVWLIGLALYLAIWGSA